MSTQSERATGFTLFEMLMVLGVIAILASVSVASFSALGKGRALQSAQSELHAMLRVARAQAILEGTEARLLINYDENDPERFLRFYGVAIRSRENSNLWRSALKGSYLPESVYVVPRNHAAVEFVNWPKQGEAHVKSDYRASNEESEGNTGVMSLDFPATGWKDETDEGVPTWIAIAFAPSGKIAVIDPVNTGPLPPTGLRLVLANAPHVGAGKVVFEDSSKAIGLRFRASGHAFAVNNPSGL